MDKTRNTFDQLDLLLGELLDEASTDEAWARLSDLLQDNPAAQDYYLSLVAVHTELAWKHESAPRLEVSSPTTGVPDSTTAVFPKLELKPDALSRRHKRYDSIHWQRHKIRFSTFSVVMTAFAWVGFSYFVWFSTTPDDSHPNRDGINVNFVARITGRFEHRWAEGMHEMPPNAFLVPGERLQLVEGLIEIIFYDGAVVILEGPTEFVVDSPGAGTLEVGSLTATVPKRATGFTVTAAGHEIVDLGTEFGVQVDPTDGVKVFVYEGRVDAHATDPITGESRRYVIEAGEAMHLVTDEGLLVQSIPVDELRLVRRFPRPFSRSPLPEQGRIEAVAYQYGDGHLPGPSADRADPNCLKLTDGVAGNSNWEEGHWVGVIDEFHSGSDDGRPQPAIEFEFNDESTPQVLASVRVIYIVDQESGIHAPDELRITLSEDDVFDAADTVIVSDKFNDDRDPPGAPNGAVRATEIDLGGTAARFVLLEFANDKEWTFLGEISFVSAAPIADVATGE